MSKENNNAQSFKIVIVSVTVFILLMTIIVYFIVENDIASKASNDGWLSYFGGLVSGMATLIAIFISVYYMKKDSDENFNFLRKQAIQSTLKGEYINLYKEVIVLQKYLASFRNPVTEFDGRYEWQNLRDFFPLETYTRFNNYYLDNSMFFSKDIKLSILIDKISEELHQGSAIALSSLNHLEFKISYVESNLEEWLEIIEDIKKHISFVIFEDNYHTECLF